MNQVLVYLENFRQASVSFSVDKHLTVGLVSSPLLARSVGFERGSLVTDLAFLYCLHCFHESMSSL